MNLHEYQSKDLLRNYQVPVPASYIASTPAEAVAMAKQLGGARWVVKAQVHAGGRGKAGGVKVVDTLAAVETVSKTLLGHALVTAQTDAKGQPVHKVLIEAPSAIVRELYVGATIDRIQRRIVFMASTEGGVDIEEVAAEKPHKILKISIDPRVGMQPYQCRHLFFQLDLDINLMKSFTHIMMSLYRLFFELDLSLLEINPLVLTEAGELVCLDAKLNIDDNALYRQNAIRALRDTSQENERETRAQQSDLSYIALEGNIGCMVNGAGLAMATMDLIKLNGGQPANFLDVGGSATEDRVMEAFKIIVSDEHIKAILVNIFGGIVRCDLIADGIIRAIAEVGVNVPVVVRLEGNNSELGAQKLAASGLNIIAASGFAEAAEQVVIAAKQMGVA